MNKPASRSFTDRKELGPGARCRKRVKHSVPSGRQDQQRGQGGDVTRGETPVGENSQRVAKEFVAHAETIEARERTSQDASQRESLRRAAAILREFADSIGPSSTPVRRLGIGKSRGPRRGFEAEIDD